MWFTLLQRLRPGTGSARLAEARGGHATICPPAIGRETLTLRSSLTDWLRRGGLPVAPRRAFADSDSAASARSPLAAVRHDFMETLADLHSGTALQLRERIRRSGSMHELWHLRAEVFSLVALRHSQAEADDRLAWLNRHFPTRGPRSGFGGLPLKEAP